MRRQASLQPRPARPEVTIMKLCCEPIGFGKNCCGFFQPPKQERWGTQGLGALPLPCLLGRRNAAEQGGKRYIKCEKCLTFPLLCAPGFLEAAGPFPGTRYPRRGRQRQRRGEQTAPSALKYLLRNYVRDVPQREHLLLLPAWLELPGFASGAGSSSGARTAGSAGSRAAAGPCETLSKIKQFRCLPGG